MSKDEAVQVPVAVLKEAEYALMTGVLWVSPNLVEELNRAIGAVRRHIPHDFQEGHIPAHECGYCWLTREAHDA